MDIVYRHIEFVTWILSIVTLLLSIVASMLSHVHHRIARPLGPPYYGFCLNVLWPDHLEKQF